MKDRNFVSYISLIVFVISHVVVAAQARATFGEPCSRTNRCDSRSSLTCNNGTCECLMADVMTFDGTKCAVFAGKKCTFTAVDVQGRAEERSWREELPCVTNSVCQEGFCTCLPEFYESDNGTCIKKHGFQEECEADLVCRNDQFLICNEEKKCGCNSTITTFDIARQLCVTKAGQPCGNGEQCVSNAKCGRKTCRCDADYFQNPKGECDRKRGYNEPCADNSYCKYGNGPNDLQLVCTTDKICGCNANIAVYEESTKLCVRLAGETCKDFPKCVQNSVCSQSGSNHVCQCSAEYFSSDGICVLKYGHGKECDLDENCKQDLKCNSVGICDCDRDQLQQFYDVAKGKCVGLAGARCASTELCVVNSYCSDPHNDYYCRQYGHGHCDYSRTICTCHDGYSKTENQTCLATYGRPCGLEETTACISEEAQTRATHGESCSRTNRCDSRACLACTDGTCQCIMPDVMTFDGTKCAVFAGEKCTFTAVDIQRRGEERSRREELPCVENSACQDGFCTCHPEFYESTNATCSQKSGYLENCEFELACKTDQFLSCNESKKCDCNFSQSIYDYPGQRCVSVAEAFCQNGQQCVSHANCILDSISGEKVCKCDSGHFANPEGKCETKRGFYESCANDNYCQYGNGAKDLQLICNPSGFCDCRANISTYDYFKDLCVRLAGEECTDFPNCVRNSECVSVLEGLIKQCVCSADRFQTLTGTCEMKRGYGDPCQIDDHCSKDLKLKCGLNGLCECDLTQKVYDPSRRKCVGLADSRCFYRQEMDCVPNAYCYDERSSINGRCKCNSGYTNSGNGSCFGSHGTSCGLDWQNACDGSQGTICKEGVCQCKYERFQNFDSTQRKCASNVPGPCDENTPCVANAHCSLEEETFRQCICDTGFVLVENKCMLTYGEACDYSYNHKDVYNMNSPGKVCDKGAPLKCIAGTCQCESLEEYDYDTKKCKGLVGSMCVLGIENYLNYCTKNASCVKNRIRWMGTNTVGTCKCQPGWLTTKTKRCIIEIAMREENENKPTEPSEENLITANATDNPI